MITLESGFVEDPLGMGDHADALRMAPIEPLELGEPENFTVRLLGEHEGVEDVEISTVLPLTFWERPGVGSWKLWRWRPWLRFRRHTWEFEATVKDDGAGNQTFSVLGAISETVTFHRTDPGEKS